MKLHSLTLTLASVLAFTLLLITPGISHAAEQIAFTINPGSAQAMGPIICTTMHLSTSHPVSATSMGAGAGAGRVTYNSIDLTLPVTKDAPKLEQFTNTGHAFDALITMSKVINDRVQPYYTISLKQAMISAYHMNALQGDKPSINLTIVYREITETHTQPSTNSGINTTGSWNLKQNKAL